MTSSWTWAGAGSFRWPWPISWSPPWCFGLQKLDDRQAQETESLGTALPAGDHRRVQGHPAPLLQEEGDHAVSRGEAGSCPRATAARPTSSATRTAAPSASPASSASSSARPRPSASRRPGPAGAPEAGNVEKAPAGIRDQHAPLHLLRLLPGSLPRGSHLPDAGLLAHRHQPRRDDLQQRETARPGRVHQDKIRKWKHKADEAAQGMEP